MSTTRRIGVVCVLLVLATSLWAQEGTRFGIGVDMVDLLKSDDYGDQVENVLYERLNYPVLYISILMKNFRIDPEFSIWRHSQSSNEYDYTRDNTSTIIHLGIGGSMYIKKSEKLLTYAGAKLGIDRTSSSSKSEYGGSMSDQKSTTSRTDLYLGPCLGAEYFVTKDLSLGCETQILFTFIGDTKYEQNGKDYNNNDDDASFMRNKALIFLRWYF